MHYKYCHKSWERYKVVIKGMFLIGVWMIDEAKLQVFSWERKY